jgi:hypothetical protein
MIYIYIYIYLFPKTYQTILLIMNILHIFLFVNLERSQFFYSVALVRERTIQTEQPPLVGEVSAREVPCGQRGGSLWQ